MQMAPASSDNPLSPPTAGSATTSEAFISDGLTLRGHLSLPEVNEGLWLPMLLICQDFPHGRKDFSFVDTGLAEFVARELGWAAFAFGYRGCGESEGDFSLAGWQRDVEAAVNYLWEEHSEEVWIVGFGVGATLGISTAADNLRVQGVAAVSAYGDLKMWNQDPATLDAKLAQLRGRAARAKRELEESGRASGERWQAEPASGEQTKGGRLKNGLAKGKRAKNDPAKNDPANNKPLSAAAVDINAVDAAKTLSPRPLLVIHGQDNEIASLFDARAIADAHGLASLRVLEGGGHNLRYDPRTLALLFSWLDRNRS